MSSIVRDKEFTDWGEKSGKRNGSMEMDLSFLLLMYVAYASSIFYAMLKCLVSATWSPSLAFAPPGQGMGIIILCSQGLAQYLSHTPFFGEWNELLN